ncbi:hypothetical protein M2277_005139 [Paenibacillus sp. LBL]|uniref:hypothetical protein n=1 Tax=unclassified Paenibacillus TaxID=185978 RepID=UPI002473DC23|nr:hypothetical protein [Paenibacillus sp. LBL]MDH6674443.1 hypothetical protein [Paenibacillus sp. LBL]
MSKDKQKIKKGDSVILRDGSIHEISSIQDVHNRYQLVGVSGWQNDIDSLVLVQPGSAYRYWQLQAAAAKEEIARINCDYYADKQRFHNQARELVEVKEREQKLKERLEDIKEQAMWSNNEIFVIARNILDVLYPKEREQ